MNKNLDDQAEKLREQVGEYQEKQNEMSSLPPRSSIHKRQQREKKNKKPKWRVRFVLIRLFLILFLLLIVAALVLPNWL
ncbi:hypothetical protein [Halalkalibacter hemicellulosilyticus]|uniref:Uncharacterized protein n=1 Tax=Halalkalibacter hemicellulosilyticusJCM 9152 TaxID=1236971 RepID=W4QAB2_9BACI|nr:hypothetical protein [Halalkalibacter hemicellulosilyticus]GAE28981.1 hypothetical protein JCM9152_320 [Halalkalibacter hemicellulosilyticusJCM 9152]